MTRTADMSKDEPTIRVCPMRDAICPHGPGCLYNTGHDCDMEASRAVAGSAGGTS